MPIHSFPPKPFGRADHAFRMLNPNSKDRVLNIGCFNGGFELHYLYRNAGVTDFWGVDVNAEAVESANQWAQNIAGVSNRFQVCQAENLPFESNTFDKVVCLDTFEHVANEQEVANEIFRVLKPGGSLVLSVPHDFLNFLDHDEVMRLPRNLIRTHLKGKPLLDHPKHRHYSEEQLRTFFANLKFETVHKCGTPVFWTLGFLYTAIGLPEAVVTRLSSITSPLENWDYKTALPTGFNIMIRATK